MLLALIVALVLVNVAFIAGGFWYLDKRDTRDKREREILWNRIQSPATAVAQTLRADGEEYAPPKVVPYNDGMGWSGSLHDTEPEAVA